MSDPLFGKTWRMDSAKSLFSSNFAPSEETRLYEEVDNGYKLTVSGVHNGQPYSWHYTALYDGQPHPVVGRADVNSITIHRISDRITVGFFKKDLVPGGPYARFLSDDLQTLTVEAAGRNDDGSAFYDVTEYHL
jgi:hypothetical protein